MKKRKQLVFAFSILIGSPGYSQQVDSLSFFYGIHYKRSYTIDGAEKRGMYGKREELVYQQRKHVYRVQSFQLSENFHEWDGGFGRNLITDSLKSPGTGMRGNLPKEALNEFLKSICAIQADSVFPYEMKDIPDSYLKANSLSRKTAKSQLDVLIQKEVWREIFSNVTGHFHICFHYQGVSYDLHKDSNNVHWTIFVIGKEEEDYEPIHFLYFAFDAFLKKELPKKFSGLSVFNVTFQTQ